MFFRYSDCGSGTVCAPRTVILRLCFWDSDYDSDCVLLGYCACVAVCAPRMLWLCYCVCCRDAVVVTE